MKRAFSSTCPAKVAAMTDHNHDHCSYIGHEMELFSDGSQCCTKCGLVIGSPLPEERAKVDRAYLRMVRRHERRAQWNRLVDAALFLVPIGISAAIMVALTGWLVHLMRTCFER